MEPINTPADPMADAILRMLDAIRQYLEASNALLREQPQAGSGEPTDARRD